MHYRIYKISNAVTPLLYVGCTTDELRQRFLEHTAESNSPSNLTYKALLHIAIREYGKENFAISLLEEGDAEYRETLERERHWIVSLNTAHPHGYNKAVAKLSNEDAAIIRYNAYDLTRDEYAALFEISPASVSQIQSKSPVRQAYRHITRSHLPSDVVGYAQSQGHLSVIKKIDTWYTAGIAALKITKNSGRKVSVSYISKLGALGKIRTQKLHERSILYYKPDVDVYVVETRG